MAFTPGQRLQNGKYVIDRLLNQGRFGVSYLAHDKKGDRFVIKTFKDDTWQGFFNNKKKQMNRRWLREAGVLSRLEHHPHIVWFHEPFLEREQVCLVMEYIDGQDLASLSTPTLPITTALEYIRQIGSALQVVHAQGLVHRDVKPANIMLRAGKPEVVLIDFGLAGGNDETITMNNSTREKGFTAPELYDPNQKAKAYTDVYSLGATLYKLLSGESPPSAEKRLKEERLTKAKSKLPSLPRTVDQGIYDAITRAMELNWDQRLQTVDEFLNLLNLSVPEKISISPLAPKAAPDLGQLAFKETRLQTRVAVISLLVAILLGLFGQELKSFLMSRFSPPVPEKQQERK